MKFVARLFRSLISRSGRGRVVLCATLASLVFGALQLGYPLNNYLHDLRNWARTHPASGEIVLVAIDDRSISELGVFPWPREYHGDLAEKLDRLGAKRTFFDITFETRSRPDSDRDLADAVRHLGRKVYLPVTLTYDPVTTKVSEQYPLPELREHVSLAHINIGNDQSGAVRRFVYELPFGKRTYPSLSSAMADVSSAASDAPIDLSIDPRSIPTVSAVDIIKGRIGPERIAGRDVIIGATYQPGSSDVIAPGYGALPAVYMHILGAETLKAGVPLELPWLLGFCLAFAIVALSTFLKRRIVSVTAIGSGMVMFLTLPLVLDSHLIFTDIMPSLLLLTFVATGLSWSTLRRSYQARGTTNAVSGLPNLVALAERREDCGRPLVAVRVHNYAAAVATLSPGKEKVFVEQIARRLAVGATESKLYQGDEGIFAWFSETGDAGLTGIHLDALHSLFRNPVVVDDKQFDLVVTFGFDADCERSIPNRVASALVAADNAQKEGVKWKAHNPSDLEDSAWKLSLLSQLDTAIDAGDLWVAYQPKVDLKTGAIVGAEALARWTHPEKGPISPLEFIIAAEESNRIEKLTYHVLEHAIRVAAVINRHGPEFSISVNLSARLIDDPTLVASIRKLLTKHGLEAHRLTLEVTETAALGDSARSFAILRQLRDMGIQLSVDDYGTGMSTLEYLQRIPATEIKIDRTFVIGMQGSQATRVMVNSTIQLAHSLGQKVVAEGVEDEATLEELKHMNCDLAQGYLLGRPMTFRALSKTLLGEERNAVA